MKKLGLFGAFLALGCLTGCLPGAGSKGGEADAIENAKLQTIVSVSRKTQVAPETKINIGQDKDVWNNDYLYLATKQIVLDENSGKDYTVEINWTYDATNIVREKITADETHESIYFNYSETEEYDFSFTGNFKCGSATGTAKYEVHLLKKNVSFKTLTLQQIYAANSTNDGFEEVDKTTGYYKQNNESFPYMCVETYGKVVYVSPDGNWGLIADGDYVLELYSGSGLNLDKGHYAALEVGNTVKVWAELGSYFGNCQVSFIFDIVSADASKAAASTGFRNLAEADFAGKHYWEGGLMNSLRSVTAKYAGNLKQDGKTVTAANLKNGRFTFDVTVGSTTLSIAYDYHVDRNGDLNIFKAYQDKIKALNNGDDVTIKGTLRFSGPTEKSYKGNESATTWSLTPYLADHIA